MQDIADQSAAPTTIGADLCAIFVSLELSRSTWLATSLSPGRGEKMSKHSVSAGDIAALLARFSELRRKACARTGKSFPIIVIQEAGLDGFWIHRVLQSEGIESHVVDAASILTSRRRRRAKTDRVDGETLVRTLMGLQAWRATSVFDGKGADAAGGGSPTCLPRAPDAGGRAGEARQPDQGASLRPGGVRLRAAAQGAA